LLLAHTDGVYAAVAARYFRQCGWDVVEARSGSEARRLARQLAPTVVVLDSEFRLESGWLTCAKLADEHPYLKVILTTPYPTAEDQRFGAFVGASDVVDRRAGVTRLVEAVFSAALRAVG
jgi:DNA-binding response OmpR family regulator